MVGSGYHYPARSATLRMITQSDISTKNPYRWATHRAEVETMPLLSSTPSSAMVGAAPVTAGSGSAIGSRQRLQRAEKRQPSPAGRPRNLSTTMPGGSPLRTGDVRDFHQADPEQTPVRGREGSRPTAPSTRRSAFEWAIVIFGAMFVAFVVRVLLLQVFFIPSESMDPTLQIDDKVLVDKLTHRFTTVERGQIVVFTRPAGLPESNIKDLVKRVIAVQGDTIEAVEGQVYVNGQPLNEPYLKTKLSTMNLPKTTIGSGHVFVMGDNRQNSTDSRVFGPIPESTIVGHARAILWPWGHRTWFSAGEK
jgi:signal peptidase I